VAARVLNAATVLAAERVTTRDVEEMPNLDGRIRFITSHHVPDYVEDLIGTEVPMRSSPGTQSITRSWFVTWGLGMRI
jgi:hypothetical protein